MVSSSKIILIVNGNSNNNRRNSERSNIVEIRRSEVSTGDRFGVVKAIEYSECAELKCTDEQRKTQDANREGKQSSYQKFFEQLSVSKQKENN